MRRALAALVVGAGLLTGAAAFGAPPLSTDQPVLIAVEARALPGFEVGASDRRGFGRLVFLGGLELSSSFKGFGGLSGLSMRPDGSGFVAVTDKGYWLEATLRYEGSRLAGIEAARIGPLLDSRGRPLASSSAGDAEAVAGTFGKGPAGELHVSIERRNRVLRFPYGRSGMAARGTDLALPPAVQALAHNKGLEALTVLPEAGPYAGVLLAIAENAPEGEAPAWLLGPAGAPAFTLRLGQGWSVTDAVALPGGEVILLQRRHAGMLDIGMRLASFRAGAIRPGAAIEPSALLSADLGHQIDNMEGLGAHRAADGRIVLTIVSDDNFSTLQRTLLLQFELRPEGQARTGGG